MKTIITLSCLAVLASSCAFNLGSTVIGSGDVVEVTRDVGSFDSIDVSSSIDVFISQGEAGPLTIKAEDNLVPLVKTTVRGSTLRIDISGSYSTKVGIDVFLTTPKLRSIIASGSSDVLGEGRFESEELSIQTSGSSDVECAVVVGSLSLKSSGSSDIVISGTAKTLSVVASGSSDVSAFELVAIDAEVKTSGSSDALVNARNLDARATGSSDIRYRGLPEKLNTSDSGSASIGPEDS